MKLGQLLLPQEIDHYYTQVRYFTRIICFCTHNVSFMLSYRCRWLHTQNNSLGNGENSCTTTRAYLRCHQHKISSFPRTYFRFGKVRCYNHKISSFQEHTGWSTWNATRVKIHRKNMQLTTQNLYLWMTNSKIVENDLLQHLCIGRCKHTFSDFFYLLRHQQYFFILRNFIQYRVFSVKFIYDSQNC